LEPFQLAPEPIQRRQNVSFVLSLLLPVFVPPSPSREQTAFGVFRELLFQIGFARFRFLVGATGVGIIRIPIRIAACAFREFADVGFEPLDLGLFFRPAYMGALTMAFGKAECGSGAQLRSLFFRMLFADLSDIFNIFRLGSLGLKRHSSAHVSDTRDCRHL